MKDEENEIQSYIVIEEILSINDPLKVKLYLFN